MWEIALEGCSDVLPFLADLHGSNDVWDALVEGLIFRS